MSTAARDPHAEDAPLPATFEGFRDRHAGESLVVCGCGASLTELREPDRFVTIGVNDVGRLFQPDYLVVLNSRGQFAGDRFRYIAETRARAVFTQLRLGIDHPRVVTFRLGRRGGTEIDGATLPFTRNSPYVAAALALHMGARRIGLIGVDFTDDHFFARTGRHPLVRELAQIDREYARLRDACQKRGIEIVNLSPLSRLTSLPRMPIAEFDGTAAGPVLAAFDPPPPVPAAARPLRRPSPVRLVAPARPLEPSAAPPAVLHAAGASVVMHASGEVRLSSLRRVLGELAASAVVAEVIVVETAPEPRARPAVEAAGGRYIWSPGTEKARAMNVGIPFVHSPRLFWIDGDVLPTAVFLRLALAEMDGRNLDCLVPWTSLRVLAADDAAAVEAGLRLASACAPSRVDLARAGGRGGALLVRTEFVRRYGGMCEEFAGADSAAAAWFLKSAVLGRAAVTSHRDQHLHRLGSRSRDLQTDRALMQAVRRLRSPESFVTRFPPPAHFPAPWRGRRRVACDAGASAVADVLRELYADAIEVCGTGEPADGRVAADTTGRAPREVALEVAARLALAAAAPARVEADLGQAGLDLRGRWPWPDDALHLVNAHEVIGYLPDKIHTLDELWRVLRPGGTAELSVLTTDGPGAFADPLLVSCWNRRSFDFVEDGNPRRDGMAARQGVRACFHVVAERIDPTPLGPRLTITLRAVKRQELQ